MYPPFQVRVGGIFGVSVAVSPEYFHCSRNSLGSFLGIECCLHIKLE